MLKFSGVDSARLWTWVDKTKADCVLLPLAADFSSWSSAVLPRTELTLLCLPIAYGFQLNLKTYYWKHFLLEAGAMDGLHFKGEIRAVQLICHFCSDLLSFVLGFSIPSYSHFQQDWHISWCQPVLLHLNEQLVIVFPSCSDALLILSLSDVLLMSPLLKFRSHLHI